MDGQTLDELLFKADSMPDGQAKLLLLEEAARIADSLNDIEKGYDIRTEIIYQGIFSGYSMNAIIAFSWCLSQYDRNPERFSSYSLLWEYKWILGHVDEFPDICLGKIDEIFEDMRKRYLQQGASLRAYYSLKCKHMMKLGQKMEAEEFYRKWTDTPRDYLSDCKACDLDSEIEYLIYSRNYQKALELVKPILSKQLKCHEVPHITYQKLLLPLLEIGKKEEAQEMHEKGYKLINKNKEYIVEMSNHLTYLAITNPIKALNVFEKHFHWAYETYSLYRKFQFYLASWMMFFKLKTLGYQDLKLRLQHECDIFNSYDLKDIDGVLNWFEKETRCMAGRFNDRNGNEYFNEIINEKLRLAEMVF